MVDSKRYRTKHEFYNLTTIPKGKDYIIGLDVGYSGTKVFYESGYFCFPSFVKKIEGDVLSLPSEKDILYRDNATQETYMVGYTAQEMLSSISTNDTDEESFSRKRFGNHSFYIPYRTALGIALSGKKDNRGIFLQTGLPASYVKGDTQDMVKELTKDMDFSLKVGKGKWQDFKIQLKKESINIISQPFGGLYSTIVKKDGHYAQIAQDILYKNTLVGDFGFGTGDIYGYKSRAIVNANSIDNIGMREVMQNVSKMILDEYGEDIRIQSLQHNLETGVVICTDDDTLKSEERPITEILERSSDLVFQQAMAKTKSMTNSFRDFSYFIVSGGTGEAWFEKIKNYLSGLKTLKVLPSNLQDPSIPFLYSNARGYYFFRYIRNK